MFESTVYGCPLISTEINWTASSDRPSMCPALAECTSRTRALAPRGATTLSPTTIGEKSEAANSSPGLFFKESIGSIICTVRTAPASMVTGWGFGGGGGAGVGAASAVGVGVVAGEGVGAAVASDTPLVEAFARGAEISCRLRFATAGLMASGAVTGGSVVAAVAVSVGGAACSDAAETVNWSITCFTPLALLAISSALAFSASEPTAPFNTTTP